MLSIFQLMKSPKAQDGLPQSEKRKLLFSVQRGTEMVLNTISSTCCQSVEYLLIVHVSVPTFTAQSQSLSFKNLRRLPSRHEGQHYEGIPKGIIGFVASRSIVPHFGQAEDLEK